MPEGIDWAAVVKNSMDRYSVEIAGGLGPTASKVWRVGIMVRFQSAQTPACASHSHSPEAAHPVQGYNATLANVELVVAAFRDGLQRQGYSKAE